MTSLGVFFALTCSAAAQNPSGNQEYLILATARTSTMQEELDQAARRGFRVKTAAPKGDEIVVCLERDAQGAPHRYLLLATSRTSTMQRELSQAGARGFRVLPQTAMQKGDEIVVLLEQSAPEGQRYEYRLLATQRTSTLEKELNEASRDGFVLKEILNRDENVAIMERRVPENSTAN
jgi:hypothetical protein